MPKSKTNFLINKEANNFKKFAGTKSGSYNALVDGKLVTKWVKPKGSAAWSDSYRKEFANTVTDKAVADKKKLDKGFTPPAKKKSKRSQTNPNTSGGGGGSSTIIAPPTETIVIDSTVTGSPAPSFTTTHSRNVNVDTTDIDSFENSFIFHDEKLYQNLKRDFIGRGGTVSKHVTERVMSNMINGIFGIPYQLSTIVDQPVEGTDFGRMYMEKFIADMPVMFISPGEPLFMAGYNHETIQSMVNAILDVEDNDLNLITSAQENGKEGRYYTFNSKMADCARYINVAVQTLANFKNIGHLSLPTARGGSIKLSRFNILEMLNPDFARLFGSQTSFPFYLDSETQISESFSNDTTESMVSQAANGFSDKAREVQFLLGTHSTMDSGLYKAMKKAVASTVSGANDLVNLMPQDDTMLGKLFNGRNILGALTSELTTVVSGGKLSFPEIWSSSSYSKSYSVNMKFRSPDPDPLSILMNVELPIIILVAMTAGRQFGKSANAYGSPHIIRATYKSIFNCDLGIIGGLSINRGGDGKWNSLGMSTSADVSLDIRDLYSTMFISKTPGGMYNNTAELDWLALMAGLDVNKPEFARKIGLKLALTKGYVSNTLPSVWDSFKEGMNKSANRFLDRTGLFDTRYY